MSSINGSAPFVPAYQPAAKHPIDNDVPRKNSLDKQAGEDAEVSNGKGGWKNIGNATRDHANRTRLDRNFLPSDKKIVDDAQVNTSAGYHRSGTLPAFPAPAYNPFDDLEANTQAPYHGTGTLPAFPTWDYKALDDSASNAQREPIDFEIKPDGNGGWTKA